MSNQVELLENPAAGEESDRVDQRTDVDLAGRAPSGNDARADWVCPHARLIPFLRFYAHHELPRYGQLLDRFGMNDQPRWVGAPVVEVPDRFHGYRMRLNLADFYQRIAWFFGCYGEMHILSVLSHTLRPGDHYVDGGAYIGLVTLHAAGLVKADGRGQGRVDCFEPSRAVHERLHWHVRENNLRNVHVHEVGLSDREEVLELRIPGFDNMASGTLGPIPQRYGQDYHDACEARTAQGDDVLGESGPASQAGRPRHAPLLIKLDVEGFELRALRGLRKTIERRLPAILMEVNDEMLGMNGATPHDVYEWLSSRGYLCFGLDRCGFRRRFRLKLHLLTRELIPWEQDVLWLHPCGVHWQRLKRYFQRPGTYWRHINTWREAQRGIAMPGFAPVD